MTKTQLATPFVAALAKLLRRRKSRDGGTKDAGKYSANDYVVCSHWIGRWRMGPACECLLMVENVSSWIRNAGGSLKA